MADHEGCAQSLVDEMRKLGVEVRVLLEEPDDRNPYKDAAHICSHGTYYWILPTAGQILEWNLRGVK